MMKCCLIITTEIRFRNVGLDVFQKVLSRIENLKKYSGNYFLKYNKYTPSSLDYKQQKPLIFLSHMSKFHLPISYLMRLSPNIFSLIRLRTFFMFDIKFQ